MLRANLLRQRLLVLFLFALFAFFSPMAARFEGVPNAFGIPSLYLYLFGSWALVIALAAWICSRGRE
jgi:quinol-cytochrome oxidoreductase complex cytochrome b subunit